MKRNKFSLSKYKLLTGDMGELLPCGLTEVLAGDTMQMSTSLLVRLSPLLAPVMHPCHVRVHHWFVPHRIVWDDFEKFITGGPDGNDASVLPTIALGTGTGPAVGSLADYLGVPTGTDVTVSALPFRGYAKIWNDFYRDQDLETKLTISTASGVDATTSTALQNVAWEKDMYTTARGWTQKGSSVAMPLAGDATVERVSNAGNWDAYVAGGDVKKATNNNIATKVTGELDDAATTAELSLDPNGGLTADLSSATGPDINEVREAFALQRYKEARAKYGSRYTEYLRYLGIRPKDGREDAVYLGGGKQTIQFSEVLQTAGTTDGSATGVGDLKGHGIGAMRSNRFRKFFDEHGFIFSFISVKPKTMYCQGLEKHWIASTKEDFFQKELQHIGQEEILQKELYTAHSTPTAVFGYQDRYDSYRRGISSVSADFRSTLAHWHMARIFSGDTTLNASFVSSNPTDRIFASTSTDSLWMMANHSIQARRMVASEASTRM